MTNFFPKNLKFLRIQSGYTQLDIAKRIKKDYSTVGKWELGQRNPSTFDLIAIADIFNVSVRDIVEKDLTTTPQPENINFIEEYKKLFEKDNKLTDVQKEFIFNTITEQHERYDNESK